MSEDAARTALAAAEGSDLVLTRAEADLVLADVLEARGRIDDAEVARAQAVTALEAKGFRAAVDRSAMG